MIFGKEYLEDNLNKDKVIAIGEIGLDYYYTKDNKEKQIELFELQLQLAEKYNMPVIVHSREATKDTIDILKKYNVRGTIHSFSGSIETAKEYIKMGFLIGVNGVITFKNGRKLREVVEYAPVVAAHAGTSYAGFHIAAVNGYLGSQSVLIKTF